jgi:uncharacterized protein
MTSGRDSRELVGWLSQAGSYPHAPASVEHVQTHISDVFLAGPIVYKLKKPVRYDFLDFSTVEAREFACREELRLNRRLAADAYLDVVPVTESEGAGFQIGGSGQPIDWLVKMRRLPTDQSLESLHHRGELRPARIDRLADVLADFYRSLDPLPIGADEYRSRCLAHVRGNRQELLAAGHHLPAVAVERVHAFQLQTLLLAAELFDERVRAGRIVEGHGDLRPEHICLSEPPVIFDCIEFSADFRRLDVADELAFLAAECDFLGADWVGPRLLKRFQELTGDRPPAVLLDFYRSYRACVRAKVAALRADQLAADGPQQAIADAQRHLELADRYAQSWRRPLVLIVGGLSGTGKSTLAAAVAEAIGARLLRTDLLRQELFGTEAKAAGKDEGLYQPQRRQQVYDEMFRRAAEWNQDGLSVVLDGTFATAASVAAARWIAAAPHSLAFGVECICRPEVARERIRRRSVEGRDASQAWAELHDFQMQEWQPWPADLPHCRIDTEQPLARQVEQALGSLGVRYSAS